jgi:hypothetical protein
MPGMTPDQARAIADDLIEQERAKSVAQKNATAKPVPWYYRVPELDGLEPWERSERVAAVRREVQVDWAAGLAAAIFAALCAGLAWKAGWMREGSSSFAVYFLLALVPVNFFRAYLVRRRLRSALAGEGSSD